MAKKVTIHVEPTVLRSNYSHKKFDPPITVWLNEAATDSIRCHRVEIKGPSVLVHSEEPHKSGSGARVWIECDLNDVIIRRI